MESLGSFCCAAADSAGHNESGSSLFFVSQEKRGMREKIKFLCQGHLLNWFLNSGYSSSSNIEQ